VLDDDDDEEMENLSPQIINKTASATLKIEE